MAKGRLGSNSLYWIKLRNAERDIIVETWLEPKFATVSHSEHVRMVAEKLGISVVTLYDRARHLGIDITRPKAAEPPAKAKTKRKSAKRTRPSMNARLLERAEREKPKTPVAPAAEAAPRHGSAPIMPDDDDDDDDTLDLDDLDDADTNEDLDLGDDDSDSDELPPAPSFDDVDEDEDDADPEILNAGTSVPHVPTRTPTAHAVETEKPRAEAETERPARSRTLEIVRD